MRPAFFVAAAACALAACVVTRYYQAGEVERFLDDATRQVDGFTRTIDGDFHAKATVVERVRSGGDAALVAAFAARLAAMGQARAAVSVETTAFFRERDDLRRAIAGRAQIPSDDPAYARIDAFHARADALVARIKQAGAAYQARSNEFAALATEKRIPPP